MRPLLALPFAMSALASPADAAWYSASSQHFLIYSEQKPETLRRFADELERFDSAVRLVRGMDDLPPSKGNRLTVFVSKTADAVQKLATDKSGMIQGFYVGRVSGSVAYVSLTSGVETDAPLGSHIDRAEDNWTRDDTVLLHEYAHHLMFQDQARPYPQWFVEGFAEFMSTAQFDGDGSVGLGLPAKHRFAGLMLGHQLPLATLISGKYDDLTGEQVESLYGRGWLLTHYLTFEPSRKGQLASFIAELEKGVDPLDAAQKSFGDLKQLDRDLDAYLRRSKLLYAKISPGALKVGPIEVSPLTAGASSALPLVMRLKDRPTPQEAEALASQLAAVEAHAGADPLIEASLSEAELVAGKFDAAEAAADRAMAADPQSPRPVILKGRAIMERAAKDRQAADFTKARDWFLKANQLDHEDPDPLYEFYSTYVEQGIAPTANAISALHYASVLAPQDEALRLTSAEQFLVDGKGKEARAALVPVAYDPHGGGMAAAARAMITAIDAGDTRGALGAGAAAPAPGQRSPN